MTLCVLDEADVLDAHLAFHLHAGVDHIIATDTAGSAETVAVLERYQRAGVLELWRDHSRPFPQAALRTRMARAAATDFAADWVFSSDVDEFWWPRGRDLKSVLEALPSRYGVVSGIWRPFVARPDDGSPFYERMTVRLSPAHAINDPTSKFRPSAKVAHRAHSQAVVQGGSHSVSGTTLVPLQGWYPIEVLHFPMRSPRQMKNKYENGASHLGYDAAGYIRRAVVADAVRGSGGAFAELLVDDDALEQGLAAGVLTVDTRLRDALATIPDPGEGRFALPGERAPLAFPAPSVIDDARFAADVAALGDASLVRAQRRLDDLERRLRAVEHHPAVRLRNGVRRLARKARLRRQRTGPGVP